MYIYLYVYIYIYIFGDPYEFGDLTLTTVNED